MVEKKKQNEVETAFLKLEEMSNAEEPGKKKQKKREKNSARVSTVL